MICVITVIGNIIVSLLANRKVMALVLYRLDELEKKQDRHNSLIERTYKLEDRMNLAEAEDKRINKRLENLERAS